MQGYNAQAVATCEQIIVTAELTQDANDLQQLEPVLTATAATLAAADIKDRPETLAADSGYWSIANLTETPDALVLLIPPPKHSRHGKPRKDRKPSASRSDGLCAAMTAMLQSEDGICATACLVPDKHQAGFRHARNSGTRAKRERLCSASRYGPPTVRGVERVHT